MRFFRPGVQRIINLVVAGGTVCAVVLPATWAYRQGQEARLWRETACVYRLREAGGGPTPCSPSGMGPMTPAAHRVGRGPALHDDAGEGPASTRLFVAQRTDFDTKTRRTLVRMRSV